jgi:hypothetical protein
MRKLGSFKNATLRRKGFIEIKVGFPAIPIFTVGDVTLTNLMTEYTKNSILPKIKQKPANTKQLKDFSDCGYDVSQRNFMVTDIDTTTPEFLEFLKGRNQFQTFAEIAVNIDLYYATSTRKRLWETIGLKSEKDYLGLTQYLIKLDLLQSEVDEINKFIAYIRNSNFKTYEDFEKFLDSPK